MQPGAAAGEPERLPVVAEATGKEEAQVPRSPAWPVGVLQDTEGCFLLGFPGFASLEAVGAYQSFTGWAHPIGSLSNQEDAFLVY